MSIEVSGLTKIYGIQKAVNNISFSAASGEIVGFLGPNGAGKSTTMKIITGYLAADAGKVTVCGIDVAAHPLQTKQKIGYLPESNALYYDMYVREYLRFIAGIQQIPQAGKRVEAIIATVGLTPESKKKIGQLSKGYKQRVGLAAAMIHDPEVLILDEPTTGLDPNQIVEIREVIKKLGKEKTVLFSSHILPEVEALCDRVLIINHGELVADNTLEGLRKQSAAREVVKVSFRETVSTELLQQLPGVAAVHAFPQNSFELVCTGEHDVKRELLSLSLQRNFNIVSLQSGEQKLEDVFRNLTGS